MAEDNLQDGRGWHQDAEDGLKMSSWTAHEWPRRAQDGLKIPKLAPKRALKTPEMVPKNCKNTIENTHFRPWPFRWPKITCKMAEDGIKTPKMA